MTNWVNRAEVIARIVDAVYAAPDKEFDLAFEEPVYLDTRSCPNCGNRCDYDIPNTRYCCHCGKSIVVMSDWKCTKGDETK